MRVRASVRNIAKAVGWRRLTFLPLNAVSMGPYRGITLLHRDPMDLDSPHAAPIDMGHRTFLEQTHGIVDQVWVAAAQFADLPVEPLNPPLLGRRLHLPPLLVPLHALSWQARLELLERADAHLRDRGRPLFCTLLASDAPDRVRNHLMTRMAPLRP